VREASVFNLGTSATAAADAIIAIAAELADERDRT
jgi:hypothetical protein